MCIKQHMAFLCKLVSLGITKMFDRNVKKFTPCFITSWTAPSIICKLYLNNVLQLFCAENIDNNSKTDVLFYYQVLFTLNAIHLYSQVMFSSFSF